MFTICCSFFTVVFTVSVYCLQYCKSAGRYQLWGLPVYRPGWGWQQFCTFIFSTLHVYIFWYKDFAQIDIAHIFTTRNLGGPLASKANVQEWNTTRQKSLVSISADEMMATMIRIAIIVIMMSSILQWNTIPPIIPFEAGQPSLWKGASESSFIFLLLVSRVWRRW